MAVSTKKKPQKRSAGKSPLKVTEGPGELRNTVELPFTLRVQTIKETRVSEILGWMREGEEFARILESDECPDAAREIFERVFGEHLFERSGLGLAEPNVVRVLYPLTLIALQGNEPATAEGVAAALYAAVHTLTPGVLHSDASERARLMYVARQQAAERAEK